MNQNNSSKLFQSTETMDDHHAMMNGPRILESIMSNKYKNEDEVLTEVNPLVLLWWDDSFGGGGWIDKEDQENRVAKCVTAGFLIGETDDHITVTCSMTEGKEGQYLAPITIPKSCITRRENLKQNAKVSDGTPRE